MPRNHLKRFADLNNLPNVFQGIENARNFNAGEIFGNSNPVTLELACGKGEYTLALAEKFPERNFIGVERKGNRLWNGAKTALERNLKNAAFFRMDIELLEEALPPNSISEIWITFPDPHPRLRQAKNRLTSSRYLKIYRKLLIANGIVHLKTDNDTLVESTLQAVAEEKMRIQSHIKDVYSCKNSDEILFIKTKYEDEFLRSGQTIKYICFR